MNSWSADFVAILQEALAGEPEYPISAVPHNTAPDATSPWALPGQYTVGSADGCDLRLDDRSVQQTHAYLYFQNGRAAIQDANTGAVFVNGIVKSDPRLRSTPVVLVTSLDAPEDRALGLEAGADGYLVKREVERGKLLEVVRQLMPERSTPPER